MKAISKQEITLREQEILTCLAEGLTTDETARRLFISHETVKTHRRNLLLKMHAKNAFQLGIRARAYNLVG